MPNLTNQQLDIERCPHCGIDINTWGKMRTTEAHDGTNKRTWATYNCMSCGGVVLAAARNAGAPVTEVYPSAMKETFNFKGVPPAVAEDFQEALDCYSISRFNAFGSMCRRTIQSVSMELGAAGKDKIKQQLKDAKAIAPDQIDETHIRS